MARLSEQGIRLSSMSPSFLNSNSTSHTWPFSAVAELIDNASDPGVHAKQVWVDVSEEGGQLCLTFTDNGNGMTHNKLHKMLSFGFTDKGSGKNQAIGIYGNGFKSGSMRLGSDALVFTKNGGCQTVGMLSQTYLHNIKSQAVIVPIVPFSQNTKSLVVTEDSEVSLAAITQHSIVSSVEQIHAHFDSIPSKKGTKILIWNIRRAKDGKTELDFDTDESDIRLPEICFDELKRSLKTSGSLKAEQSIPEMYYSLKAYLSILYLKPRTQVILRGKKILAKLVAKSLKNIEHDVYKPHFSNERVQVTFGLSPKNKDQYGMMMYYKNRLIKAYEKVGCQLKTLGQRAGVGVIGVIECNFLKPAHSKQDFEYTKEYRLTHGALGLKLNQYWKEMTEKKAREREFRSLGIEGDETRDALEGPMWVQCEDCLKWRSVPEGCYSVAPESWKCSQNPNPRYRSCSSPEETENMEEYLTASYPKKQKDRYQVHSGKPKHEGQPKHQLVSRSSSETCRPAAHQHATGPAHVEAQKDDKIAATLGNEETFEDSQGNGAILDSAEEDPICTDTFSFKRKWALLSSDTKKKRLCLKEESGHLVAKESDPETQTLPSASTRQDHGGDPQADAVLLPPGLQRTSARLAVQKLDGSKAEAQRFQKTPCEKSQDMVTEENEDGPPAKHPPSTVWRDISCQTDRPEYVVLHGPNKVCELKQETDHNKHRKDQNESWSCVRGSESRGSEGLRAAQTALRSIRSNLVVLLTALLPQLDLSGVSLENPDVDNILEQIIQINSLKL